MPPTRPARLVRRQPLSQRIQAMLNPMDFYLWVSEEIQTLDWDSKDFGTWFGAIANFVFLVACANTGASKPVDDVFGDPQGQGWTGWIAYVVHPLVWILVAISVANCYHTATRMRRYRLFEANVEEKGPSTPSAKRVRVDSSPAASSPLRLLQDVLAPESAEARAHPDKTRDVWEVAVWDPFPANLQIFCLFSPGHVLIYMLFLPLSPLDPWPTITVFKSILLQAILSAQLMGLVYLYSQQNKDTTIIQKEVMHEYDTKYVHPRLHPTMRDATTQITTGENGNVEAESVDVGTPSTLIRRGFKTNPNPNYVKHFAPDSFGGVRDVVSRNVMSPGLFTPIGPKTTNRPRQSLPPQGPASPAIGTSTGTGYTSTNFGGNLGVYTHKNSPLKKATSMGDIKSPPRNSREMAALEQRDLAERMIRQSSPLKDNRRATTQFGVQPPQNTNPFAARPNRYSQERFPSRC